MGVLVLGEAISHEVLTLLTQRLRILSDRLDERCYDLAAGLVGDADDPHLRDLLVIRQYLFDLAGTDAIAAGDDQVVVAGLEPEIPLSA